MVCLNGHSASDGKFCTICGAKLIKGCLICDAKISGITIAYGMIPSHCSECGEAFPWTKTAIEAAQLWIEENNDLSDENKQDLLTALPDLAIETPKSNVAVQKLNKVLSSVGKGTADLIKKVLADVASEFIKRNLGL